MIPQPNIVRENGVVWISREVDQAFRAALLEGVPRNLLAQMSEALALTPQATARQDTEKYFGKEYAEVILPIGDLLINLNQYLSESRALPGLFDWFDATGYGNHHKMIAVLKAWSEMKLTPETKVAGRG